MRSKQHLHKLSRISRRLGLIRLTDNLHYLYSLLKTASDRRNFKREHSDIRIPPDYALYETYKLDYSGYYFGGMESAKRISSVIKKYKGTEDIKILDWGCGIGRIIQHMDKYFGDSVGLYGSDYNLEYINWCKNNIKTAEFNRNRLFPPLLYENETFDVVYGISIFTHLSEELHELWFDELIRVLKKGGVLILTLHGDAFSDLLSKTDKSAYDNGLFVAVGKAKLGHRTYGAFHPTKYVRSLIGANKVLEHNKGDRLANSREQDLWVVEKV